MLSQQEPGNQPPKHEHLKLKGMAKWKRRGAKLDQLTLSKRSSSAWCPQPPLSTSLCTFTTCTFYHVYTIVSARILPMFPLPFFFSFSDQNTSQGSKPTTLIVLYVCFSTKVTFNQGSICEVSFKRNRRCGIVTTNSRCVVSCCG